MVFVKCDQYLESELHNILLSIFSKFLLYYHNEWDRIGWCIWDIWKDRVYNTLLGIFPNIV